MAKDYANAPKSKYAAKREHRVANAIAEQENVVQTDSEVVNNESANDVVSTDNVAHAPAKKYFGKPFKKRFEKGVPDTALQFPEHVRNLAIIIKNNAEIRRFTAIAILNYLKQKGEISGDNKYVSFKWNKFAVKSNGLMREYSYIEPFFLKAFVAAFASFSSSAQRTLDNFIRIEQNNGIIDIVSQEDVDEIVAANEAYVNEPVVTD